MAEEGFSMLLTRDAWLLLGRHDLIQAMREHDKIFPTLTVEPDGRRISCHLTERGKEFFLMSYKTSRQSVLEVALRKT